jgi:hypothetical protein
VDREALEAGQLDEKVKKLQERHKTFQDPGFVSWIRQRMSHPQQDRCPVVE